jgi:hypothetical protein
VDVRLEVLAATNRRTAFPGLGQGSPEEGKAIFLVFFFAVFFFG